MSVTEFRQSIIKSMINKPISVENQINIHSIIEKPICVQNVIKKWLSKGVEVMLKKLQKKLKHSVQVVKSIIVLNVIL